MGDCKDCKSHDEDNVRYVVPNIILNISFYDNRVNEDSSTYVDNIKMDSEE